MGGSLRLQRHLTESPLYIFMPTILLRCCVSTAALAFDHLQSAFCTIQSHLFHLSLVLNGDKTKVVFFSNKKKKKKRMKLPVRASCLMPAQHTHIEAVATYKYLVIAVNLILIIF